MMRPLGRVRPSALLGAAIALLLAAAAVAPAWARELTEPERSSLVQTVERFEAAMRKRDSAALVSVVPPRIITLIAESRGVSAEDQRRLMVEQGDKILASGVILGFDMEVAQARYRTLADGMPYALIPTDTTLKVHDTKVVKHTDTLALIDDARWYLVRINQPVQIQRLVAVYPSFAGVEIGGETTKVVP